MTFAFQLGQARQSLPGLRLFVGAMLVLFGSSASGIAPQAGPCGSNTEMGAFTGGTYPNGNKLPTLGAAVVCKDAEGGLYVQYLTDGSMKPPKGSTLKWTGGSGEVASLLPAAGPFVVAVTDFLESEMASLLAQTPVLGLEVFALEFSDAIKLLGDSAELWGDTTGGLRLLTDGAFGLFQELDVLSILASSTADGLTPVRYDLDTRTLALGFALGGGTSGGNTVMRFVDGDLVTPHTIGLDFVITANAVAEPASLLLVILGLLGLSSSVWPRSRPAPSGTRP